MATLPHLLFGQAVQAFVTTDEDISEELASIIGQDCGEIVLNLLHILVVRRDTCAYKSKWMWVTIDQIDSTIVSMTLQQVLSHVESGGTTSDYRESELFLRLDNVLVFDILHELGVVVLQ